MNKKIPISLALAIAIVAMTVTFTITMIVSMKMFDATVSSVKEKENMYTKIAELDESVREAYYGEIDDTQLYDTMSAGYLAGLGDKYAKYYTASQYSTYQDQLSGKLMGIGVEVVRDAAGLVKVVKVYEESPAAEAGITDGCYFTAIDNVDLKSLSIDAVRTLLQGEAGTVSTISLMGADMTTESKVEVSRRSYSVPSVEGQVVGVTGYLRIKSFNENTPAEFENQLQAAVGKGVTGLVIDLRDTASTDVENAVRVLDLLCPRTMVGSAVYKTGDSESLGMIVDDDHYELPIVLIVNGGTECAAELFCVTLQDTVNAKVVGVKTAGHGSIQTIVEQTDGSALAFTVAKMVPIDSARSFDGVGIEPDVEVELTAAEASIAYDLTTADDPQILRAFEMVDIQTGAATASGMQEAVDAAVAEGVQDLESLPDAEEETGETAESTEGAEAGEEADAAADTTEDTVAGESAQETAEEESASSSTKKSQ